MKPRLTKTTNEKKHEQVGLGHQHMLNSTQLSVGLEHRHDPQQLWPAGLGHRHKPHNNTPRYSDTATHTLTGLRPSAIPTAPIPSQPPLAILLFFVFSLFEKEGKETRRKGLPVPAERPMRKPPR